MAYAIGFPLSIVFLLGISSWTKVIFSPWGFATVAFMGFVLWVAGIVLASVMAYRSGEQTLSKVQTWYVYIGFFIISSLVGNVLLENRGKIFGYETFRFPSKSMANTLMFGDFIISDTWRYKEARPSRGDLIVFLYPKDTSIKYVKRVIGMPNDIVRVSNGEVFINDKKLEEPYVDALNNQRLSFQMPGEYAVPEHAYFVMGDNRDNSNDSRFWGFVPENYVYGSVEFIWLSYDPTKGFRNERIGKIVN